MVLSQKHTLNVLVQLDAIFASLRYVKQGMAVDEVGYDDDKNGRSGQKNKYIKQVS